MKMGNSGPGYASLASWFRGRRLLREGDLSLSKTGPLQAQIGEGGNWSAYLGQAKASTHMGYGGRTKEHHLQPACTHKR